MIYRFSDIQAEPPTEGEVEGRHPHCMEGGLQKLPGIGGPRGVIQLNLKSLERLKICADLESA